MTLQIYKHLDEKGAEYEKKDFSIDTEKGAANVANALGFRESQMVKTLIFKDNKTGEKVLVMVGGDQLAQSKNLKKAIGSRDVRMASDEEVVDTTGYKIGSIPPVGWQPEGFRTFIEESLLEEEVLGVGTGEWGKEVLISPKELVKAIDGLFVANLIDKSREVNPREASILEEDESKYELEEKFRIQETVLTPEEEKVTLDALSEHVGEVVTVEGWVFNKRSSGKIAFLQLRDGFGFRQGILEKSKVDESVWETSEELTIETSVKVTGEVTKHPKKEEYEIQVEDIEIISLSPEYPIGKKEHGVEFLFDNRDLYMRSKTPWAVLRIRDQVMRSVADFLFEEKFVRVDSPIFQPTSAEDTSELFEVDFYGNPTYLTQSGQLYSEAAIMGLGKVYDYGPVFRAEKSKTRNHLSEFWMMDAEMAFYDQDMNEDLQERLIKRIVKDCLENCQAELELMERDTTILESLVKEDFLRMKHADAKKELEADGFDVDHMEDMTTEEEIYLGNKYKKPIFIEDYPFEVKAFYMKSYVDEDGVKRARCADLIAPEEAREIIGGSQREDDYQILLDELKARDYPLSEYEWYLNIRKFGSVPHSGFGIGTERVIKWISGVHHIRETIPFPRTVTRMRP